MITDIIIRAGGQLKIPLASSAKAVQIGDDLYGERPAGKAALEIGRRAVALGDLRRRRRGWTRRQRASTCGIAACRTRCDKSIHGERGRIRSLISGKRFDSCSPPNQAYRQRQSLSICSKRIGGRFSDGQVRTLWAPD